MGEATLASAPSKIQVIVSTHPHFPESVDEDGTQEANVILNLAQLHKDRVGPAFAGEITHVQGNLRTGTGVEQCQSNGRQRGLW